MSASDAQDGALDLTGARIISTSECAYPLFLSTAILVVYIMCSCSRHSTCQGRHDAGVGPVGRAANTGDTQRMSDNLVSLVLQLRRSDEMLLPSRSPSSRPTASPILRWTLAAA